MFSNQLKERGAEAAIFVMEYSIAKIINVMGITPRGMIGHGVGEYVAGCISGVFSIEDAISLIAMIGKTNAWASQREYGHSITL